jgi:hypothetical protein
MRTLSILVVLSVLAVSVRADERGSGSISGVVRLVGQAPEIAPRVPVYNTAVCGTDPIPVRSLVLGTNQAVANVVVYLGINAALSRTLNGSTQVVDEVHCDLVPRIQIINSGSPLVLRNSDPTLHVLNVEMLNTTNAPTLLLTAVLPYAGDQKPVALDHSRDPKMLKIVGGNDEDGAVAYVAVLAHDFCSLTDQQGRFTIHNVPPGNYKLYLWHEVLGTLTRDVHVAPDRPTLLDVEFPSPGNP